MKFLLGTVRPISLVAWVPVVVGALTSNIYDWGLAYGSLAIVLTVGFSNALNNLIDRFQDRHDPRKETLAVSHPVQAYYTVLFLLPPVAFLLTKSGYNNVLLAYLFYTGFWYSYVLGRIPYLKRVVVALCVGSSSFLCVLHYPPLLWLWTAFITVFIYLRESRKDKEDMVEDAMFRFQIGKEKDWWCLSAPILASSLHLLCLVKLRGKIDSSDVVATIGTATFVWSYIQIRRRYGEYKMRSYHRTQAGRLGIVVGLVGLAPTLSVVSLLAIVWINACSILYRSFLPKTFGRMFSGVVHDALLWASIPLVAAAKTGVVSFEVCLLSTFLFLGTIVRQECRLGLLRRLLVVKH